MKPLRLAVADLTRNVYVGRLNAAGDRFLDGTQDVTSDFYKAVIDRFLDDDDGTIRCSDGTLYEISVKKVPMWGPREMIEADINYYKLSFTNTLEGIQI